MKLGSMILSFDGDVVPRSPPFVFSAESCPFTSAAAQHGYDNESLRECMRSYESKMRVLDKWDRLDDGLILQQALEAESSRERGHWYPKTLSLVPLMVYSHSF
jgi:hypothetical protein